MPRPLIVVAVLGFVLGSGRANAQDRPAADTVWRFQATTDIKQLRVCSATELLATTKTALVGCA